MENTQEKTMPWSMPGKDTLGRQSRKIEWGLTWKEPETAAVNRQEWSGVGIGMLYKPLRGEGV